jgi:GWxTD domain-containing protein
MRLILFLTFSTPLFLFAQKSTKAKSEKQLQAYFDYKIFQIPNDSSYIEGYIQFQAAKLYYKPVNEKDLQGQLAVQYELKRGDSVYARNTYTFLTPVMKDSIVENFIEVFRVKAKPGIYDLKLGLLDVNSKNDFIYTTQIVEVPSVKKTPSLSDVIIAEHLNYSNAESAFNKNGVIVYPRIQNFFDTQDEKIPFYIEAYHLDSTKTYALRWSIYDVVRKENLPTYSGAKKLSKIENPVITSFVNIANLPTGEYNLILDLMQNQTTILAKKEYFFAKQTDELKDLLIGDEEIIMDPAFQASITDDSVYYYTRSLFPIVGRSAEKAITEVLKTKDKQKMRNYLEKFWIAMSKVTTPKQSPYDLWLAYKGQVMLVERKFKAINMPGYATDRGRVYLQYGSPSSIIAKETSPSEYPYEIWTYDKIKQYSNRKFIFYSPDLLQSSYQLLHSDMFGELQNYRWQHDLTRRNSPTKDIDNGNDGNMNHYGGNSSLYYNQH